MQAQTLNEAEVTAKMNEAFALNNAKKTAEALDAFLLVGRNTEQQRNYIYAVRQWLACVMKPWNAMKRRIYWLRN